MSAEHNDSNPKLWSYARACRRLAAAVRSWSGSQGVDDEGLDTVVGALQQAADQLARMARRRPDRGTSAMVENVLSSLLDPEEVAELDSLMPTARHEQVLHAKGALMPAADLVGFLSSLQCTGVLSIETGSERFELEFVKGDIHRACSNNPPEGDRLGDILVENGSLMRDTVEGIAVGEPDKPLGQALLEHSLVTRDKMRTALDEHIRRHFARLFASQPVSYTFWAGPEPSGAMPMRINSMGLILDSARVADERANPTL